MSKMTDAVMDDLTMMPMTPLYNEYWASKQNWAQGFKPAWKKIKNSQPECTTGQLCSTLEEKKG